MVRRKNFTREMILRANEDMMQRKAQDISRLPQSVVDVITSIKFSEQEINSVYADILRNNL